MPPVTSTCPFVKRVAVWDMRAVDMLATVVKVPVDESYNSAEASAPMLPSPPATKPFPLCKSVAVCLYRASAMLPVVTKPAGVTLLDATDAALVPTAFVAVTVNVYDVPFVSPVTVAVSVEPPTLAVAPPGLAVTV